jgi:copper(I)-binding protein
MIVAASGLAVALAVPAMSQGPDPAAMLQAEPPVTVGDLTVTEAWARATPPGAVTAAGYLTIANNGVADDRLLSVTTAVAEIGELHAMTMTDGRMTMRPLEDGLVVPAGATVVLRPGAAHLMFVGVGDGLVEGTLVEITLTFATAGAVTVNLVVFRIGSPGPGGGQNPMVGM